MKTPDQKPIFMETSELNSLELFIDDLEEYNKQFHWGTLMGEAMVSSMGEEIKEKSSYSDLFDKHKGTLARLGLSMEPVERKDVHIFTSQEGQQQQSMVMRINVENAEKFNTFLSSLDESNLNGKDLVSLQYISDSLSDQIKTEYDLESGEEDRLFNLFAGLEKIVENYKDIGDDILSRSALKLEKYLDISRAGYMREYVIAENANLIPLPDEILGKFPEAGFTMSTWQEDSGPDSYENHYWANAFKTYDEIKKNPAAKSFAYEILNYMKKCALAARNNIEERHRTYPEDILRKLEEEAKDPRISRSEKDPNKLIAWETERTKGMLEVLDRVEARLDTYK